MTYSITPWLGRDVGYFTLSLGEGSLSLEMSAVRQFDNGYYASSNVDALPGDSSFTAGVMIRCEVMDLSALGTDRTLWGNFDTTTQSGWRIYIPALSSQFCFEVYDTLGMVHQALGPLPTLPPISDMGVYHLVGVLSNVNPDPPAVNLKLYINGQLAGEAPAGLINYQPSQGGLAIVGNYNGFGGTPARGCAVVGMGYAEEAWSRDDVQANFQACVDAYDEVDAPLLFDGNVASQWTYRWSVRDGAPGANWFDEVSAEQLEYVGVDPLMTTTFIPKWGW